MRSTLFILGVLALAGCESQAPATRAGMALDRAGTNTGEAVTHGAHVTGNALDNAGSYVKNKVDPNP